MAIQIKEAISVKMPTTTNDNMTTSPVELEKDLDPIAQSPKMTNEDSTPMEVDADLRKRKVTNDNEEATTTNRITPTRNLRPQKHR